MAWISQHHLAEAVVRVECVSVEDRVRLGEEVQKRQPNLFYSVLVLHRYGATME